MFDKIAEISLLYDFYGKLLTTRQQEAMRLYHEENLSLAEIAEEFSISRQGVHDAIKNAEKALNEYEEKLGLVEKFSKTLAVIDSIDDKIDKMIYENEKNKKLIIELKNIKKAF